MNPANASIMDLRIGVVSHGQMLEDLQHRPGRDVTLGYGRRNTIVLPSHGLPSRQPLFVWQRGCFHLVVPASVSIWLKTPDTPSLDERALRSLSPTRQDETVLWPLSPQSRGAIHLNDLTIGFQFVPRSRTERFPRSRNMKGWLNRRDWLFSSIFLVSFLAHSMLMTYAMAQPRPPEVSLENVQDRFASLITRAPARPAEVAAPSRPAQDNPRPAATRPANEVPSSDAESTEDRSTRSDMIRRGGILAALNNSRRPGQGVSGRFSPMIPSGLDLVSRGTVGLDLASLGEGSMLRHHDPVRLETSDAPTSVGVVVAVAAAEKRALATPKLDDGLAQTLEKGDAVAIADFLKTRQGALQACYDMALNRNQGLSGKLLLTLKVAPDGQVRDVHLKGEASQDESLASCLQSRTRSWKLPALGQEIEIPIAVIFTSSL